MSMRRAVRWTFVILGVLFLWRGGTSIFRAPTNEVLYAAGQPRRICVPQICTTMMSLEVGNTGTAPQDNVRVRFRAAPLQGLKLPLKVLDFGKVDRRVKMSEAGGERVYELGRLEPQKRVEFQVVFHGPASELAPTWSEILVGVEAAAGDARPGDPALIQFARFLHAFFGWL